MRLVCSSSCFQKCESASLSHARSKHKVASPLNKYIDTSGICPVCRTNFFSRTRVLAHVSETRVRNKTGRKTCRQRLLVGDFTEIISTVFADAAIASRTERREAQRRGRTHTLATIPAKRQARPEQYSQLRPCKRLRTKTARADIISVPIGNPDALKRRRVRADNF